MKLCGRCVLSSYTVENVGVRIVDFKFRTFVLSLNIIIRFSVKFVNFIA